MSIYIECSRGDILESFLGLDVTRLHDDYASISVFPSSTTISNPCNLTRYRRLHICTDIIDHQIVGGTSSPLLASIPIEESGRCVDKLIPRYLQVRGQYLESIEIALMTNTETGELFPIPRVGQNQGFVECTLHFRRKSLFQSCI